MRGYRLVCTSIFMAPQILAQLCGLMEASMRTTGWHGSICAIWLVFHRIGPNEHAAGQSFHPEIWQDSIGRIRETGEDVPDANDEGSVLGWRRQADGPARPAPYRPARRTETRDRQGTHRADVGVQRSGPGSPYRIYPARRRARGEGPRKTV